MLNKTFLITRPNYESTTSYLYYWSKFLLDFARKRVTEVLAVEGDKVTRKEFEGRLKKTGPDYVHLNGHGNADVVTGHNNEVILDNKNASQLKGKIVYAISCKSARNLGPYATSRGARAYVGYKEDFIFFVDKPKYAHPTDDESAKLFLAPALSVSENLLKGKNVDQAVKNAKSAFTKSILEAANSEVQSGHSAYVPYILWDREHLTYSGDGKASLV